MDLAKLRKKFLIATAIEAMAEAWTLAEKNGLDRVRVAEMLTKTLFACPIYQSYGERIARQQYDPVGFRLALGLKDVDLALQTASSSQMPMPSLRPREGGALLLLLTTVALPIGSSAVN